MEKNRIRPITNGKSSRMSYSRQKEVLQMPNLIEVQKDSYQWFLDEGLKEVFRDISPIADYSGHLSLEFVDFTLCEDDVKYTIEECKERDATYAAPLKVRVRLYKMCIRDRSGCPSYKKGQRYRGYRTGRSGQGREHCPCQGKCTGWKVYKRSACQPWDPSGDRGCIKDSDRGSVKSTRRRGNQRAG